MVEDALSRLAEKILNFDEASLTSLLEKYKKRMEDFSPSKEWEKAVIIFFIINAVRAKNYIFNEQLLNRPQADKKAAKKRPELYIVK